MRRIGLGIMFVCYSLLILVVFANGLLANILAKKMLLGTLISGVVMLICGIVFIVNKNIYVKTKKISYLLILPIVMTIFAGNGELSIELASNRASNLSSKNISSKINEEKIFASSNNDVDYYITDDNYIEILNFITNEVESNIGKTVNIRGYVIEEAEYITKGYFAIGKYYITCCAADAGFVGILVKNENIEISEGEWFEIEGVLSKTMSKYGEETLCINPSKSIAIEEEGRYIK